MDLRCSEYEAPKHQRVPTRQLSGFLMSRAYSVILFGALFCTLAVKFFHAWRYRLINEYLGWILADVSCLLLIELILSLVCFAGPGNGLSAQLQS